MGKLNHLVFLGRATILVCGLWLFVPAPVMGETFRSADYGFSSSFSSAPDVGSPKPCEYDDKDNTIAMCAEFSAEQRGISYANVVAEKYNAPMRLNVTKTLKATRDAFVDGGWAITSSHTDTYQGFPAVFLSVQSPDGLTHGRAVVVMAQRAVPTVYNLMMLYTNSTSAGAIDDLNKFVDSFKIE